MHLIKVGAAVLNQTPLDWEINKNNIIAAIEAAKNAGVSVLCLPELCITGYGCEDAFYSPHLRKTALSILKEVLPLTDGIVVCLGLPIEFENSLYNCACLIANKKICGFVAKRFLAGEGVYYEPRWFKPWPRSKASQISIDGQNYPIGDLLFDLNGLKIGFEICEDAWVTDRPGIALAEQQVDIILNPSASHFAFGKLNVRKAFVTEGARNFGVCYVYANLQGNESGRIIFDGGALIAASNKLLAVGPRFSFLDYHLTTAAVDIDQLRAARVSNESTTPKSVPFKIEYTVPAYSGSENLAAQAEWESSMHIKHEEFTRAVAIGLFDYLRKSGCRSFVVSLSGGADSSAVACLVALMIELGTKELGKDSFLAKLAYGDLAKKLSHNLEITHRLLTCIYQSTDHSSTTTRNAAHGLATYIGADFLEFSVQDIVNRYVETVSTKIQRKLDWSTDDLALQNIQARVRAPSAWLVANTRNALLLVTSNRSEAAVGYATMDGDTAGTLCPIGGVDKAYLRSWLLWLEKNGPVGLAAIPALKAVNAQEPTAELRPPENRQTDEADLMPYEILNTVERAALLERQSPLEIFQSLEKSHKQHDRKQLAIWIEKFFVLWCRNQWKRERYAPAFHLDDESLDPKTWCRFPILSGSYKREIAELKSYVPY